MFEFSGVKIILSHRRHTKNDEIEFSSDNLDEVRAFAKKNLSKMSCGVLKKNGKVEWMFFRQYGNKIKWEHWGEKKEEKKEKMAS